ncbi:MAG: hypothetical protein NVS4B11_10010 [Ktedonobacteraceae bacterium]
MHCENTYLIINPRVGQDMTKLTDVFTILSAAGWDVDNALVEYGGHAGTLAAKAAKREYDLIIAHGGDGTTNEVVNAVMQSKERKSIVGVLPGGTANQWPHEISVPVDPIKAALALINSDVRKVDVGRIVVQTITFPTTNQDSQTAKKQENGKKQKKEDKIEYYFLLTAGLGIDASVISHTSKSLKERIGSLAFDVAAAKELPEQHPFSVEICEVDDEHEPKTLWQGESLQIVLGNTRLYGDAIDLTPNAYVDDGLLDICIITANSPFTKLKQMASLVLRHKPDSTTTTYVQGAHLTITLPATIGLQLDGSAVELLDCLNEDDREALKQAEDPAKVMVTYRFDVLPQALRVAIPCTYDNTLFVHASHIDKGHHSTVQPSARQATTPGHAKMHEATEQRITQEQMDTLLENSKQVTVLGVTPNPDAPNASIIAGSTSKASTGVVKPAAVCVNAKTSIYRQTGEQVATSNIEELQEGTVILVEGKESKRGVIQASSVIL